MVKHFCDCCGKEFKKPADDKTDKVVVSSQAERGSQCWEFVVVSDSDLCVECVYKALHRVVLLGEEK